jgi:hypothetical protein
MRSRKRIRFRIEAKVRIRISIAVKGRIRIPIEMKVSIHSTGSKRKPVPGKNNNALYLVKGKSVTNYPGTERKFVLNLFQRISEE